MTSVVTDGRGGWVVTAQWLGAERVIFRGDLFACLRYEATVA